MASYQNRNDLGRAPRSTSLAGEYSTTSVGQDVALLVARILLAAIFVQSGFSKLMALDAFIGNLANQGVPMPEIVGTAGAAVEFLGGLAILLGAWTRLAAVALIAFTVAATLIAHQYWASPPEAVRMQRTQFMKNVAIIGGYFALLAAGAGRYSIDGFRRRGRR
jgi:putative oxidoreductase